MHRRFRALPETLQISPTLCQELVHAYLPKGSHIQAFSKIDNEQGIQEMPGEFYEQYQNGSTVVE